MKTSWSRLLSAFWVSSFFVSINALAADEGKSVSSDTDNEKDTTVAVGKEGIELEELEQDYQPKVKRLILPPFYSEKTERTDLKAVFPFYFNKKRFGKGASTDLGLLPFYWRHRSENQMADVYFPFYWRFRGDAKTDLVLQTYYNRSEVGYNLGFAPLFFIGKNKKKQKTYQVILPPLFFNVKEKQNRFTLAVLFFDKKNGDNYKRGFVPFYFQGRKGDNTYLTVLPPLFWRFKDEINYKTTTVLPPFFVKTRKTGWSAGLLPLLYFARDENWARTMVLPFYYGSRWGNGKSHYFLPLLSYYKKSPTLSQGGVALFYHWYKSEGDYLKMYSPLFWRFGNTRTAEKNLLIPPLFYRKDSPVQDNTMVAMVYWNFHNHHKERTLAFMPLFAHNYALYEKRFRTWVFPTFDFGKNPNGFHIRLHPLFYLGKNKDKRHFVLAPLIWRFVSDTDRNTVFFPLWWNFRDLEHNALDRAFFPLWWQFDDYKRGNSRRVLFPLYWNFKNGPEKKTVVVPPLFFRAKRPNRTVTGVVNFVAEKGELKKNPYWLFRFFPFVELGKPPVPEGKGAYWSVLGGIAGWRRQGDKKEFKALWIPFDVSDDELAE